jgi:Mannosyltransferase (PIG-V)
VPTESQTRLARTVALATDRDLLRFLAIRVGIWFVAALTLLWAPLRGTDAIPPFRAYNGFTDLLFGAFAQWDSVWFIHIAEFGYDSRQITAFFPLYPLVVAGVAAVAGSTVVAGVIVSLAAGAVAVLALKRIAEHVVSSEAQTDTILLLALFPIGYVFTALYSDALFLALATASFLAAQRRRALLSGTLGALAVGTRVMGLALIPALIVLLWPARWSLREVSRLAPVLLLPLALGAYALYLENRFGDATVFLDAQTSESWNRDPSVIGPLSGLWQGASEAWHGSLEIVLHLPRSQNYPSGFDQLDVWALWNVLHFALLIAALALTWIAWRRLGPAFGLYSAGIVAIALSAPAEFVPLVSLPRFLLADFPLFIALAQVLETRPRAREAVLLAFAVTSGIAAVAFSRKVWVA